MGLRAGIDLGGSKIEIIVLDGVGTTCHRQRVATPQGDYRATVGTVAALVESAEATLRSSLTVGIGHPGSVSPQTGLIRNANSTCLNDQPLRRDLQELLGRELRLANDADCFALSEASDGAAAGARSVFGVILGTGVGGGLVIDGRLLVGCNGIAGEWGHNRLDVRAIGGETFAPACYCGRQSWVGTWLSGPGLAADCPRCSGPSLDAAAIAQAAADGDAEARSALLRHEARLAAALATVINIVDPECIVLGGGLSQIAGLSAGVSARLERHVFSDIVKTRLLPPRHGDASGARGAAWLWAADEAG